jgi:hypothetical protein
MTALKYQKYIITEVKPIESIPSYRHESPDVKGKGMTHLASLLPDVAEGAPDISFMWLMPDKRIKPDKPGVDAHTHDFDEVLGFYGCDPYNPRELFGEVEFWLEDEKYLLTKSCIIYIPKGLKHCPLTITRMEKPILHFGYTPITPT